MEIELSVTFAPELREAVREAADEVGLSLREWLAQAAEAKLNADRDAAILAEAERERRRRGLREFLDEYQAEYGAFTEEEMAEASRKLGLSWPPEESRSTEVIAACSLRLIVPFRAVYQCVPITRQDGMRAGELLGRTRLRDTIDASVALLARSGDRMLTSDPADLQALCRAAGNDAVVVDC